MQDEILSEKLSQTGVDKPLSKGWHLVPLGEICDFLDSRRIPISSNERNKRIAGKNQSELYPYFGANGQTGWIDDYIFDETLILLAEDGGNFGSATKSIAYKVSGKYWVNNHAHVLRPKQNIDLDYLLFAISIRPDIANLVAGATRAKLNLETASKIPVLLPPTIEEQKRIGLVLDKQMKAVEKAREALEAQLQALDLFITAVLRESLTKDLPQKMKFTDFAVEVKKGVGECWKDFPVLGATRSGLALAKEPVGKNPEKYKLVGLGTIFYNPMRILIGSIAMVDEDDVAGITSPDYVVFKGKDGILHYRWLYYWLRSVYGEALIKTLARGAVRERILFKRLVDVEIDLPKWETQLKAAEQFKLIAKIQKTINQQLEAINELPAAFLRKTFTGKL